MGEFVERLNILSCQNQLFVIVLLCKFWCVVLSITVYV